ncbi:hypothetical protein [Sulfobacillus thermosulfidooxidans]|uniref:hypothetical protein n=1 Tax=Sulfobacillus thermosulfidooxidans TaxID=28034 RepID=UPI000401E30A|nr:hypothetical protein [Sulfobacillus thermosulfidooxidans]OLZ08669.1 hypothetical protein BFX05_02590 [Sulfobacillus thermosulfidooxidans]OLZ17292.1 hypothetical protein BFX06_00730 [Sulfobacillus thermosulfidooxidans]OLZ19391.1 hypothetical protein BFX07_03565 [Sulfobacillus thermosulfidooxidans]
MEVIAVGTLTPAQQKQLTLDLLESFIRRIGAQPKHPRNRPIRRRRPWLSLNRHRPNLSVPDFGTVVAIR